MNKLIYLIGAGLLLIPLGVLAADLEVTCEKSGGGISCDTVPAGTPLFDETGLVPGETVTRTFTVTNNHNEACVFELDADSDEQEEGTSLADKLWTVIRSTADWFGVSSGSGGATDNKTITDVMAAGPIALGTLAAGSVTDYEWAVTFDGAADNYWQGRETTFNFDVTFTCEEGAVGGGGDEQDCCPGPDPSPSPSPQVQGMVSGEPPGIVGGMLEKFPVTGELGSNSWLQGEGEDWSRPIAAVLAVVLGMVLVGRLFRNWSRSR